MNFKDTCFIQNVLIQGLFHCSVINLRLFVLLCVTCCPSVLDYNITCNFTCKAFFEDFIKVNLFTLKAPFCLNCTNCLYNICKYPTIPIIIPLLAPQLYFTGTQCLSLISHTFCTLLLYFSSINGSVLSHVLTTSIAIKPPMIFAPRQRMFESVC